MKFYSFLFGLLIFLTAEQVLAQNIQQFRIDPSQAHGGTISEYFDSVEYIPLETTAKSLFGEITQLIVTDSSYIIHDWDTKSILFFELSGKYITKVKESQNSQLNIFSDKGSQMLKASVYNPVSRKTIIKAYSFKGMPIPSATVNIISEEYLQMASLGENYYVAQGNCYFPHNEKPKDSVYNLITIYKGRNLYKSFLPYNQKKRMGICALQGYLRNIKIIENGSLYISTPLEHYVYKINKDTAEKLYQFIFPAQRCIPKHIYLTENSKVIDSMWRRLDNDQNIIMDVSNIFFNGPRLFFKLNTRIYISSPGSDIGSQYNFIYDTISQKLVSLERLSPDASNFHLPFLGNSVRVSGLDYYNKHFYTSLSSLKMFSEKEINKNKNPQYPIILKEYFETQHRKSNPVIVKMKLKK